MPTPEPLNEDDSKALVPYMKPGTGEVDGADSPSAGAVDEKVELDYNLEAQNKPNEREQHNLEGETHNKQAEAPTMAEQGEITGQVEAESHVEAEQYAEGQGTKEKQKPEIRQPEHERVTQKSAKYGNVLKTVKGSVGRMHAVPHRPAARNGKEKPMPVRPKPKEEPKSNSRRKA